MAKRIFILGGGRFGVHLATRLLELGSEIVIGEINAVRVRDLTDDGFHVVEMDGTDEDALREAGALDAEVVMVAIGDDMQASILTCLMLKQLGAKRVVTRAHDEKHAQVLERLGVDEVLVPVRMVAYSLAERMHDDARGERHPLAANFIAAEVKIGTALEKKSVTVSQVLEKYGVIPVLIKRGHKGRLIVDQPTSDSLLAVGDDLYVTGKRDLVARFERECGEQH